MKLIEKPQFDVNAFQRGDAVKVKVKKEVPISLQHPITYKNSSFNPEGDDFTHYTPAAPVMQKNENYYALVLDVRPFEFVVLNYKKEVIHYTLENVSSGCIDIIKLTEIVEEDEGRGK